MWRERSTFFCCCRRKMAKESTTIYGNFFQMIEKPSHSCISKVVHLHRSTERRNCFAWHQNRRRTYTHAHLPAECCRLWWRQLVTIERIAFCAGFIFKVSFLLPTKWEQLMLTRCLLLFKWSLKSSHPQMFVSHCHLLRDKNSFQNRMKCKSIESH